MQPDNKLLMGEDSLSSTQINHPTAAGGALSVAPAHDCGSRSLPLHKSTAPAPAAQRSPPGVRRPGCRAGGGWHLAPRARLSRQDTVSQPRVQGLLPGFSVPLRGGLCCTAQRGASGGPARPAPQLASFPAPPLLLPTDHVPRCSTRTPQPTSMGARARFRVLLVFTLLRLLSVFPKLSPSLNRP